MGWVWKPSAAILVWIYRWAESRSHRPPPPLPKFQLKLSRLQARTQKVAVCFWHNLDSAKALPFAVQKGLESTRVAGFAAVHLLTYQQFSNLPAHIEVIDANQILEVSLFLSLYQTGKACFPEKGTDDKQTRVGHSAAICLLSDKIRLQYSATLRRTAFSHVCVIDCDTLWLKAWSDVGFFGFHFGGITENPSSLANRDILRRKLRFLNDYTRKPGDMGKIVPPFQFVTESPCLTTIVSASAIADLCPTSGVFPAWANDFDLIMDNVLDAVNKHGLRGAIALPHVFSPVPWFSKLKPMLAGSVDLLPINFTSWHTYIHKRGSILQPTHRQAA